MAQHKPSWLKALKLRKYALWLNLGALFLAMMSLLYTIYQTGENSKRTDRSLRLADSSLIQARISTDLTRKFFELQNKAYVDIERVTGGPLLSNDQNPEEFILTLINNGCLPATVKNVRLSICSGSARVDTVFARKFRVLPAASGDYNITLSSALINSFLEKSQIERPYFSNYNYVFTVYYESDGLAIQDTARSIWQKTMSNRPLRIE